MASVYDIILRAPAPATGSNAFKITLSTSAPATTATIFIPWIYDDEQVIGL